MESQYHAESVAKPLTRSIFLKTALNFAKRDIPIFPIKGKAPLTPHGFKDASSELSRVTAMFNAAPNATGIGIPTGGFSGLVVVDRDGDSEEAQRIWDTLPPTLEVATGRGTHRYYRMPKGTAVKSRKLAADVDLKADGGYVAAAGSLHPSGVRYEFLSRLEIAELPAHLLSEPTREKPQLRPRPEMRAPASFEDDGRPILEGVRNRTLFFLALDLKDVGASSEKALKGLLTQNLARCTPALEESEVEGIVKSAFRYPVRGSRTPPEVLEALQDLKRRWWEEPWSGSGGKTERDVVRNLIQFAERHGHLIGPGVRVSISQRDLALASGVPRGTIQRVIQRLKLSGWVRGDNAERSGTDSGAFVLLRAHSESTQSIPAPSSCPSGLTMRGAEARLPQITPCFRWRGFVGKGRAGVLYALEVFGELTLEELAQRLGVKRPRDLRRRYLQSAEREDGTRTPGLIELGLVEDMGGTYALVSQERYEKRVQGLRAARYGGGPRKERKKDPVGRWVVRVVEVPPKSELERLEEERLKYEAERERYGRELERAA
jgi:hypothetical protein